MSRNKVGRTLLAVHGAATLLNSTLIAAPVSAQRPSAVPIRRTVVPLGAQGTRYSATSVWESRPMLLSSDSVAALRAALVHYGREISGRGPASVAMTLQVIDALTAPSAGEYRRRLQALPVEIQRKTVSADKQHVTVEYLLRGVAKKLTFDLSRRGGDLGDRSASGGDALARPAAFDVSAGARVRARHALLLTGTGECSYTDPDGVYYSGACATQQEIDDALTMQVALQADTDGIVREEDAHRGAVCSSIPSACEEPTEEEDEEELDARVGEADGSAGLAKLVKGTSGGAELAFAHALAVNQFRFTALSYDEGVLGGAPAKRCANTSAMLRAGAGTESCYGQGIMYTVTVGNFALAVSRLSAAAALVAPPAGAVGQAVAAGIFAAGAVVGAGIILHDCLVRTSGGGGHHPPVREDPT